MKVEAIMGVTIVAIIGLIVGLAVFIMQGGEEQHLALGWPH